MEGVKDMMGTREAAVLWGCKQEDVRRFCKEGKIIAYQEEKGGIWLIPKDTPCPEELAIKAKKKREEDKKWEAIGKVFICIPYYCGMVLPLISLFLIVFYGEADRFFIITIPVGAFCLYKFVRIQFEKNPKPRLFVIATIAVIVIYFAASFIPSVSWYNVSSGGSSSSKSWGDLEDWEKENARWAYEFSQELKKQNK